MAQRRMFNKTITNSDNFMEMPQTSQNLYFHLSMNADDDGFVDNWKSIMKMIGSKEDDLKILIAKQYIIPFESGVIVIRHWRLNNYLQKDRIMPTNYQKELSQLTIENSNVYNLDTKCIHSIDKYSIDKNSINNIYAQMFEEFWQAYPKKRSKVKCKEWYLKHKPSEELHGKILMSINFYASNDDWKKDNGKYIPYPTTFLNQKRWEDYYDEQ